MRLLLAAFLVLGACGDERPPDADPEGPWGPGGSTRGPDAAISVTADGGGGDAGSATAVTGRVCHVVDLRDPVACPEVAMGGITVLEQGTTNSTTTADNGTFSLELQSATATLVVSGSGKRTTLAAVSAGEDLIVPLAPSTTVSSTLDTLGRSEPIGTGIVAVYLRDTGLPAVGARVIAPNGIQPYYDIASSPYWSLAGPAGAYGAALIVGIPASGGETSFQATNASVTVNVSVSGVPIDSGAITFVQVDVSL
jgi:hypothetical protein